MRRAVIALLTALTLSAAVAGAVMAHQAGPCGDDPDTATGRDYAAHHIVPFAQDGTLGQGHKPGSHNGFSLCLGVH